MALLRARESVMAFFRPLLNECGLTEQQWRIIRVLRAHGDLEFHELASKACILPPSLTGMLTRLEDKRLLRRRKIAADQRRLHVTLTSAGAARFVDLSRRMEQMYLVIETQLGKQQLNALFELLHETQGLQPPATGRPLKPRRTQVLAATS